MSTKSLDMLYKNTYFDSSAESTEIMTMLLTHDKPKSDKQPLKVTRLTREVLVEIVTDLAEKIRKTLPARAGESDFYSLYSKN